MTIRIGLDLAKELNSGTKINTELMKKSSEFDIHLDCYDVR